jgi:hypothetical protein
MARLYLFVEGQTEQTFANTVLSPHLVNYGVYCQPATLIAHARRKGRVHRGGGNKYVPMRDDLFRFLKQERGPDVFFTTMLDLYALSTAFPGLADAEALRHLPYDRVQFLEQAWSEDVRDPRFLPFIALHEYETYLFCDPTAFAEHYPGSERQIAALKAIRDGHDSPELINDGRDTAPSKRIIAQFPDYGEAKSVIGPQVAERIGLPRIRTMCPHFDQWLNRLERLGSRPVVGESPRAGDTP